MIRIMHRPASTARPHITMPAIVLALLLGSGSAASQTPPGPSQADIIRALQSPRRTLRVEPTAPASGAVAGESPTVGGTTAPASAPADGTPPLAGAAPAAAAIDLAILFEFGSATLTSNGRAALDVLAAALADPSLREARIRIEGHTDAIGRPEANQRLSSERAASVRRYLVEARGIAPDRLVALGLGQSQLAYPDRPADAANRRVRVVNLD